MKTGKSEYLNDRKNDQVHVHYLTSTQSGAGKHTLESGCQSIRPSTIMLIPAGRLFSMSLTKTLGHVLVVIT
jgi:AraC family transcriptional activator of mtrCDE